MGNSKSKSRSSSFKAKTSNKSKSSSKNPYLDDGAGSRRSSTSSVKTPRKQSTPKTRSQIYADLTDLPTYEEIYGISLPSGDDIPPEIIEVFTKHDINPKHWDKLMILTRFDIYIIGDDSGSMATPVDDERDTSRTRWTELLEMMNLVVDLASVLDGDGITVSLLNAGTITGVKSVKDSRYRKLIKRGPHGGTPLVRALKEAIASQTDKPLLIIMATDGEPSDGGPGHQKFTETIFGRDGSKVFISILACTDDDNAVNYLNGIDKDDATLDVLDDYRNERKEVLHVQGSDFKYTLSDHFVRCMLGPVHSKYDKLDEYAVSRTNSIDE